MHKNFLTSAHSVPQRRNGPRHYNYNRHNPRPANRPTSNQPNQQGHSKPVVFYLIFIAFLVGLALMGVR